jgi:hypothetical protein
MIPSSQPFSIPTAAPQATIYQTNGVLFYLGAMSPLNKTHQNDATLGSSFIFFGKKFKSDNKFPSTIDLSSVASREFVSEINSESGAGTAGGIRNDITTRSTTIVGDINGDGFIDLLVGYPMVSKCSVYLGNGVDDFATIIATSGESFAIIAAGDPEKGEGGSLGWSSIRIGDLNGDGCDELVVSAISANTIYIIYGNREFSSKNLNITELTLKGGLVKIIGNPLEINFGVSLTLLHQFRKNSHADLAITAQQLTAGQNTIYVLFGSGIFKHFKTNIEIAEIMNNPLYCMRIIAPSFSYAGFSLAGIGDINDDGFDDLAIGSLPYTRRGFSSQKTYLIYGKERTFENAFNELYLSSLGSEDGFVIEGGGFLVTGIGDVNSDGIADTMITRYDDWKGMRSAYLISTPANITYSPSLQPSSFPTAAATSLYPTGNNSFFDRNSSAALPVVKPSFRPTVAPSSSQAVGNPTIAPTRLVLSVGTARPTAGKPSLAPTITPTSGFHRLRGFSPSLSPTVMPTINSTVYTEIDCSGKQEQEDEQLERHSVEYQGKNVTHNLFRITANSGIVKLAGNNAGGAINLYALYCPNDRLDVVISNFRVSTDMISVIHLSEDGYSYPSLNSIAYSTTKGPLTLLFCSENKLQVILSSHTSFDLRESNFLFTLTDGLETAEHESKNTWLNRVQVGIVTGVLVFLIIVFSVLTYQHKKEEKEELKHEEWLHSHQHEDEDEERRVVLPIQQEIQNNEALNENSSDMNEPNTQSEVTSQNRSSYTSEQDEDSLSDEEIQQYVEEAVLQENNDIDETLNQSILVPSQEKTVSNDKESASSAYSSRPASRSSSQVSTFSFLEADKQEEERNNEQSDSTPPFDLTTCFITTEELINAEEVPVDTNSLSLEVIQKDDEISELLNEIEFVPEQETVLNDQNSPSRGYSSSHSSSGSSSSRSSFSSFNEENGKLKVENPDSDFPLFDDVSALENSVIPADDCLDEDESIDSDEWEQLLALANDDKVDEEERNRRRSTLILMKKRRRSTIKRRSSGLTLEFDDVSVLESSVIATENCLDEKESLESIDSDEWEQLLALANDDKVDEEERNRRKSTLILMEKRRRSTIKRRSSGLTLKKLQTVGTTPKSPPLSTDPVTSVRMEIINNPENLKIAI